MSDIKLKRKAFFKVPDSQTIFGMLHILLGDDMVVEPAPTRTLNDGYVGVYAKADNTPGAICIADRPFSVYSASALSMLPAAVAEEALASGELTELQMSSLHEVFNICTRLVMSDDTAHLRLVKMGTFNETSHIISQLPGETIREDFEVHIPKFGKGYMTFIIT